MLIESGAYSFSDDSVNSGVAHVLYKKKIAYYAGWICVFYSDCDYNYFIIILGRSGRVGIDWSGSAVLEEDLTTVEVPSTFSPLQPHEVDVLLAFIDPMSECEDFGVHLYAATEQFVQEVLSMNNSS